ncbi:hypothetical protein, variant 1 [Phytophthora nicotianae CJ01A1]|uniref:CUE domain-containing protein n=1 Tax=Phytophthora nicotianae CJ01A1 TaxID=1317063 RepID=W2VS94_PHYNI|nr:hypothetical protein, variant 1 [Phytophthora nicotianae CJ01A1]
METLRGVFPAVPTEALLRVLEICDQSVAVASTWLLENEWQDLTDAQDEEEEEGDEHVILTSNVTSNVTSATQHAGQPATGPYFARRSTAGHQFQEDIESEDEDEVGDDDEDEEDMYYDSGDEGEFMVERIPPLTKRVKITTNLTEKSGEIKADDFWVAFDGQVVVKSMIGGVLYVLVIRIMCQFVFFFFFCGPELLNTTLSKLAHRNVVLLTKPAKELDKATATTKLESILVPKDSKIVNGEHLQSCRDADNRNTLANLLNGGENVKSPMTTVPVVPAYFFPVKELDLIWRSVMHAHLLKGRFGEKIEFHTAASGSFSKRDFDELMHIQSSALSSRAASFGFSPLSALKCCLILPCKANEDEIFRVGKNVHATLKVDGNLYFQDVVDTSVVDTRRGHFESLNDYENLTEERFRQFARYRVKEQEEVNAEPAASGKVGVDPYMPYQQPHTMKYCLEILDSSKWSPCLAD